MTQLNMLFGALFRPRTTFARLAEGVRWVWAPAVLVLLAASLANVAATVPLQIKAQEELSRKEAAKVQKEMAEQGGVSGKGGVVVSADGPAGTDGAPVAISEGDIIQPNAGGGDSMLVLAMTSGLVFGAVGVLLSLFACATFFFVAGKVWAKKVPFRTFVSLTALAALPLAARDVVQAVYQSATGTWIQHQGISALVAAKDSLAPSGAAYGLLMQIDIWAVWALVLLYLGVSVGAGFERRRAFVGIAIFTAVAVLLRAAPAIVTGAFTGAMG